MQTNILLQEMPKMLKQDERLINIQLIQTVSIMVQNIKDIPNLSILLSADIIRQLVEINCTFDDEIVDYYIAFLKTLVMRLQSVPHLISLFYDNSIKNYPLFVQS